MSVNCEYLKSRLAEGSRGGHLLLFVLSAVWTFGLSKRCAADTVDHPYLQVKDMRSETCLKCHPAKNQGKFVHEAVAQGCLNCHRPVSADYVTTITLVAVGGSLCGRCHEAKNGTFQHQPFKAGECLICHNPHTGDYQAQLRAPVNTVCSSCHVPNQADVKVNVATGIVSLLDGRTYALQSFQLAPKIGADHIAAMARDPKSAAMAEGSRRTGTELTCITCHDPHSSSALWLLRKTSENRRENIPLNPKTYTVSGLKSSSEHIPSGWRRV